MPIFSRYEPPTIYVSLSVSLSLGTNRERREANYKFGNLFARGRWDFCTKRIDERWKDGEKNSDEGRRWKRVEEGRRGEEAGRIGRRWAPAHTLSPFKRNLCSTSIKPVVISLSLSEASKLPPNSRMLLFFPPFSLVFVRSNGSFLSRSGLSSDYHYWNGYTVMERI